MITDAIFTGLQAKTLPRFDNWAEISAVRVAFCACAAELWRKPPGEWHRSNEMRCCGRHAWRPYEVVRAYARSGRMNATRTRTATLRRAEPLCAQNRFSPARLSPLAKKRPPRPPKVVLLSLLLVSGRQPSDSLFIGPCGQLTSLPLWHLPAQQAEHLPQLDFTLLVSGLNLL